MTTQSPWRHQSPSGDPPTEDRATPGTVIGGRYELIAAIGHGGMGTVWRSMDTLLHREVAVKEVILPPQMPQHEKDALCERTMREARAAAAISHPSVVQVYDVVTDANRPWIVMELLQARSLADIVIDDGPLPPRAVAKIGIAMLGALEVAHSVGVLHRDVKPANVLVCDDGRCVLTDFGVARLAEGSKLTTPGMVLGSPHFISPERAVGGAFGPPSDLFSLGVTLYTAVEGGPPFDRGDPFETMRAVVEEAPRPARLAGPLKPVLWGLLEKEPENRWDVARSRAALRDLLATSLAPVRPASDSATATLPSAPSTTASTSREPLIEDDLTLTDGGGTTRPPAVAPSGGVGGRAMLDPKESLTDQIARLRAEAGLPPEPSQSPAPQPSTAPEPLDRLTMEELTRHIPTTEVERRERFQHRERPDWADRPSWAGGESWGGSGAAGRSRRHAYGPAGPARSGLTSRHAHIGRRRAPSTMSRIKAQLKAPRNRPRVIIGASVIAAALAVAIAAWAGVFAGSAAPPSQTPTASVPLINVQEYRENGIAVNVPAGWSRTGTDSYVEYLDPAGSRFVRVTIEPTSGTAHDLLQGASTGPEGATRCANPFVPLALVDAPVAGLAGAELEYTCGDGAEKRHGLWRAVVQQGTAYHFFLSAPDATFAESKIIYDEMVRSFTLV